MMLRGLGVACGLGGSSVAIGSWLFSPIRIKRHIASTARKNSHLIKALPTAASGRARHASSTTETSESVLPPTFKLALCQLLVTADKRANLISAREAIDDAVSNGAAMVSLPECFNSPYATDQFPVYAEEIPTDLLSCTETSHPSTAMLRQAAIDNNIYVIGGSIPEKDGSGAVYNTCVVIGPDGQMVAKHRKVHLFDIDVPGGQYFKESDTLSAGSSITTFDTPFCKVGVAICYDLRFPELSLLMREKGCEVMIYPAAFNVTTGPLHWELLLRARAVDQQCYVAAASPARTPGGEGYQAWGHSMVVGPWGDVVSGGDGIQERPGTIYADVDLSVVRAMRQSIPVGQQKRGDMYHVDDRTAKL